MILLARSLGFKVIAEVLETEVQLDFLAQEKYDGVQGYYYYKPMSRKEIESSFFKPGEGPSQNIIRADGLPEQLYQQNETSRRVRKL